MQRERAGGRAVLVCIVTVVVLLPLLYLFSAGPVEWLMARGYVSYDNPFVKTFYFPGQWLMDHCRPLNDFVRWFLSLWK